VQRLSEARVFRPWRSFGDVFPSEGLAAGVASVHQAGDVAEFGLADGAHGRLCLFWGQFGAATLVFFIWCRAARGYAESQNQMSIFQPRASSVVAGHSSLATVAKSSTDGSTAGRRFIWRVAARSRPTQAHRRRSTASLQRGQSRMRDPRQQVRNAGLAGTLGRRSPTGGGPKPAFRP